MQGKCVVRGRFLLAFFQRFGYICQPEQVRVVVFLSFVLFGDIAQLGERKAGSLEVRGSTPLVSTRTFDICRRFFV